jgi:glyoxylase-like metal-dependent hydrolase (beta-lactamase superfamily II)
MSAWTDLGDGIHVRQSRAYAMNSAVLVAEDHAILIDPGVLESELDDLAAFVRQTGSRLTTLILTHDHWDHVLGVPWWPGAEIFGHDGLAAAVRSRAASIARSAEDCARSLGESWTRGFEPFTPGHAISGLHFAPTGAFRLVFRSAPGHADTQLTVHLPDERVLFAADMLSDIEIPMLNGQVAEYRATLEALTPLIDGGAVQVLVPGHGAIARGAEIGDRLRRDLVYLETLEVRVRECRAARLSLDATQTSLAEMDYTGKSASYSMVESHRDNVRQVYDTPSRPERSTTTGRARRSKGKPGRGPGSGGRRPAKRRRSNAP